MSVQQLQEHGVVKRAPPGKTFTLRSGERSDVYVDMRPLLAYPQLMEQVVHRAARHLPTESHVVCGVPMGALHTASCVSMVTKAPCILVRPTAKTYGTQQRVEGHVTDWPCVVFEDVITTGNSVRAFAEELVELGVTVHSIVALVDREQGGVQSLRADGWDVRVVYTLSELQA